MSITLLQSITKACGASPTITSSLLDSHFNASNALEDIDKAMVQCSKWYNGINTTSVYMV
jgi:hypothetical protein